MDPFWCLFVWKSTNKIFLQKNPTLPLFKLVNFIQNQTKEQTSKQREKQRMYSIGPSLRESNYVDCYIEINNSKTKYENKTKLIAYRKILHNIGSTSGNIKEIIRLIKSTMVC